MSIQLTRMSAPGLSSGVRAVLEHRPRRKVFRLDEPAMTAFVISVLGGWYEFRGRDRDGTWVAVRRDDRRRVTGRTPGELRSAVMADFAANPVWP